MTFGVTTEGFKAKRFTDIVSEIGDSLLTELNIDINSDPDSVAKIITNIYSLALADAWSLSQALQAMFDIDKAEGVHLDNLVRLIGLTRLEESQSTGREYITASQELSIPVDTIFKDLANNSYINNEIINVSLASCVDSILVINPSASVGDTISVNINGQVSSITVTTDLPTALQDLIDDINLKTVLSSMSAEDVSEGTDYKLKISNVSDLLSSAVILGTNLILEELTSFGFLVREDFGAISVPIDTVIIAPSITGITSVTNRYAFSIGRFDETDIELRERYKVSLSFAGTATVDAIKADLLQLDGVTNAFVSENISFVTDPQGLPPKSFLCVVKGGSDQDIGDSIWENKPAGIEAHGNISVLVTDGEGNDQFVKFSRAEPRYIHVKVEYSIYDEQSQDFPVNGEDLIINTVLDYGNSLSIGEDVIPQRFSSEIFQAVGGLSMANVFIGETSNSDDPTPPLTNAIIPIDAFSEADFNTLRIEVERI